MIAIWSGFGVFHLFLFSFSVFFFFLFFFSPSPTTHPLSPLLIPQSQIDGQQCGESRSMPGLRTVPCLACRLSWTFPCWHPICGTSEAGGPWPEVFLPGGVGGRKGWRDWSHWCDISILAVNGRTMHV
ncbi:hypothetical protein BO70DRAFT_119025 [Aspergillus heteromorphus CBS 117.55]|uniref:Uncharacterized protein n=1 Tax=Aspergillus heteromorphus CBS 117.55 TaxID=1448321 RepID=A0A317VC71_9EURO|nr:uncharacterized protein BO70DRAFT_119025 [Aspergillus heteromorphus CBS 117.55]PWY71605.1 hypothetical protein BO70DRAFT_119025 [Aspergillus heteromorphus CBS 117.55]